MTSAEIATMSDPSVIERAADPAQYVVLACERAKTWLAQALEHGEIDRIVELKSSAEAIRVYTAQKQLGKDAELSATEIVRRAERGLGLAIRRGQEEGTIRRRGQRSHSSVSDGYIELAAPTDFASLSDLRANGVGIYRLTDGVSEEQFEEALVEAKVERNLSRVNVVRKVRAKREAQETRDAAMSDQDTTEVQETKGKPSRPEILRRTRHIQPERVIRETVFALEGLCIGVGLLEHEDFAALDPQNLEEWSSSLAKSLRSLNQLKKELNRV